MTRIQELTPVVELEEMLHHNRHLHINPTRREMIRSALDRREAIAAASGALATWSPGHSTGRSPKDTYFVRHGATAASIDWDSPNCVPMSPDTFDMLWHDAVQVLRGKNELWITDRVAGADSTYALPIRTITDRALHALFTDNMFRPMPDDLERSELSGGSFNLIVLPYDKVDTSRYGGRLREVADGVTSDMAIATDFDRRLGIVIGSCYCGSVKKLIFTAMNYYLPEIGVLPLHCAANEGELGSTALLLGLSGTGKTSLSADRRRRLLGDDEHGWSDDGVANFEGGCYAKLINLRADKEREIYNAVFHRADPERHGAVIENCMVYPDGLVDVDDERLTPNSRGSYPLGFLDNIKDPPVGGHPETILFLTADANGVLPPVARLNADQAMLWFLMGYTSKLAGTEAGVKEPVSTFSRFFGAPFMPRNPDVYASMLGDRLRQHGTRVFLVNTGWSGGPYGEGRRMDIGLTRSIVEAALKGALDGVPYRVDRRFHIAVPERCPGVPDDLLEPRNTWRDPQAFDRRALTLAQEFATTFERTYGGKAIDPGIAAQCPGR